MMFDRSSPNHMKGLSPLARQHVELTRRYFLQLAGVGACGLAVDGLDSEIVHEELKKLVAEMQ